MARHTGFDAPFTNGQAASVVLGQTDFVSSAAPTPPTANSLNQRVAVYAVQFDPQFRFDRPGEALRAPVPADGDDRRALGTDEALRPLVVREDALADLGDQGGDIPAIDRRAKRK